MNTIKLQNWKLAGFWPYTPLLNNSIETGVELKGVTEWIDASVPGSIHHDLLEAGQIEDPYFEKNSLKCEWVASRWWIYKCSFKVDEKNIGKKCELIFKGIDYKAHIFFNKNLLGIHEGMYCTASYDITGKIDYELDNTITVLIENAPEEMAQIGYTERTSTQKARFGYKWDFSTRLINLGLYDEVLLCFTGESKFENIQVESDYENQQGIISICYDVNCAISSNVKIKVGLKYEGIDIYNQENTQHLQTGINTYNEKIIVEKPRLWYPNGYGEQPLYKLHLEIIDSDGISDERTIEVGIRKIEYIQNEESEPDSLPYTIVINNKKIYIKGVNLVPLDHLYGSISEDKYRQTLKLAKDANINLIRVWGGGLIEKEILYRLCDRYGIMVWQEFIQSSSGISNVPSTIPEFLKLLKKTAEHAVKEKRIHTSLVIWSGGNELTNDCGVPVTYDHENIKILHDIVQKYDPRRLMLPTSASGPLEFLNIENKGKNHDVHGPWKYEGVKGHYHLYNASDSLLHSEFGVDGMSNPHTLKKFLSDKNLKVTNMNENLIWRHHGEWWDTYERDASIFGEIDSLEDFIKCSQFVQAEGLRYALEANRRRMFQNSGSIVWQFNEPWPNVSCTSIVDYYNVPKLAYYYVKEAYSPVHVSMKYESLLYNSGESFKGEVFVHNDLKEFQGSLSITVAGENGIIKEQKVREFEVSENQCKLLEEISFAVVSSGSWFTIKLDMNYEGQSCTNIYHFIVRDAQGKNINTEKVKLMLNEVFSNKTWP